jgi:ApeA N-terminal domain 1
LVAVDDIEVSIATEHFFRGEDYEFSIEHRAEIEMRDAAGRAIEDWSEPAFWIEGVISFLLGSPTWIERFYAQRDAGELDYIVQRRDAAVPRGQRQPWLTLPVIRERFEQVVAGWFAFEQSDREAFLILNEYVRASGRLLAEDRLLYLARVIELYHRGASRFEQVVIPKSEQRKRVRAILEAAPDEHTDWLQNVLSRSNEKTLRERITDLVEAFGEALAPIVGAGGVEEFAATVTDNRNYFTHYSSHLRERGRVLGGIELRQLTQRLTMVVRACVLREMNFSNVEIRALLQRDREYGAVSG